MENITKGHWIFATIFALAFISFLFWSYRKEIKLNHIHYKGSTMFILSVVVLSFLLYVFRNYMK